MTRQIKRITSVSRHDEQEVVGVALAVCLLFDGRSERAIRALWDQLESLGIPTLRSHAQTSRPARVLCGAAERGRRHRDSCAQPSSTLASRSR